MRVVSVVGHTAARRPSSDHPRHCSGARESDRMGGLRGHQLKSEPMYCTSPISLASRSPQVLCPFSHQPHKGKPKCRASCRNSWSTHVLLIHQSRGFFFFFFLNHHVAWKRDDIPPLSGVRGLPTVKFVHPKREDFVFPFILSEFPSFSSLEELV